MNDKEPDNRNHKGEWCPYRVEWNGKVKHLTLLCQEGYCSECEIYKEWCKLLWE